MAAPHAMQRCSDSAQEAAGGLGVGGSKLQPFKLLALPNVSEQGRHTAARKHQARKQNTPFSLSSPRRRLLTSSCSAVHCQELTPLAA